VFSKASRCAVPAIFLILIFLDWKQRNVVFSSFAVYRSRTANLATPAGPQPFRGARVSYEFLRTLGVDALMGRDFTQDDDLPPHPMP